MKLWNEPQGRLLIILAALPPLALALFVVKYGVSVPYCDSWDMVPLLEKSYTGQLTMHDLWAPHNEHRTFFPRLMMLALARLTHWNIRYELAFNFLSAVAIFGLWSWQICVTAREVGCQSLRILIPAVSLATFSIAQFENWLWGWQFQLFVGVLASLGCIMLLANRNLTRLKFYLSGALGVFASYSFASGLVLWPLGLGIIAMASVQTIRLRLELLSTWSIIGLAVVFFYFHHHASPGLHSTTADPLDYLTYFANYLGGIFTQYDFEMAGELERNEAFACGAGLLFGLAVTCCELISQRLIATRMLLPYLGLAAYSIAAALITSGARIQFGSVQALSSRYTTLVVPAWVALLVLLVLLGHKSPPWRTLTVITSLVITLLMLIGSMIAVHPAQRLAGRLAENKARLLGSDFAGLDEVYVPKDVIVERYKILATHHLALW